MSTLTSTESRDSVRKPGSPSPERKAASYDDTDAPSVSPCSWRFFKLGLPSSGYAMLITEIIPSFVYLALSHFHIGTDEHHAVLWYNNHLYAVLAAIPSSFLIAILSDGYKYGKFIACIVMLTLMFLTGLCSLLETIVGLSPSIVWIVHHLSPYSIFVFYVTLPIRVTIFTDVFAKHRSHERARKAFAAYWVCNLAGVTFLASLYQSYFEKQSRVIHFGLLMSLLALNLLYFLITCMILMALPLELPLKNLFRYHMCCIWFALRHQPPKSTRNKKYNWLDPALQKYTQTEVKRSRSLAHIMMLSIPIIGYAVSHCYIYHNYYNYAYELKWFGLTVHSYNCFYVHMLFTIIFIFAVEVVILPMLYHSIGHFNGIWLLVAGYFVTGIPLSILVYFEFACAQQNITRYYAPSVRMINGYPERVLIYSDWLGPGGGKGRKSIHPGEVLTIRPPQASLGTYGEATVFAYPSIKVTDFLAIPVEKGQSSTYFLSPFQNQRLELEDYDVRRKPPIVSFGSFHRRKGTVIISCSPDLYDQAIHLKCDYTERGAVHEMKVQRLCTTKSVHNGVAMETRPVPAVLNWPSRKYTCGIGGGFMDLRFEAGDFASLHIASNIDPETKVAKKLTFDTLGGILHRDAYVILTSLDILQCKIPSSFLIAQLITHGLSTALVLVSVYTIHCLHGPPRMRMTSYALPHIGAYIGLCIERGVLNTEITPLSQAIVFEAVWLTCFMILTLIAVCCRFEYHSWEIPWRPSIFWNLRAWLNIRLHHRSVVKDKPPVIDVGAIKNTTGILQHDVIKDKTVDDDKSDRKVRFSEEE